MKEPGRHWKRAQIDFKPGEAALVIEDDAGEELERIDRLVEDATRKLARSRACAEQVMRAPRALEAQAESGRRRRGDALCLCRRASATTVAAISETRVALLLAVTTEARHWPVASTA